MKIRNLSFQDFLNILLLCLHGIGGRTAFLKAYLRNLLPAVMRQLKRRRQLERRLSRAKDLPVTAADASPVLPGKSQRTPRKP